MKKRGSPMPFFFSFSSQFLEQLKQGGRIRDLLMETGGATSSPPPLSPGDPPPPPKEQGRIWRKPSDPPPLFFPFFFPFLRPFFPLSLAREREENNGKNFEGKNGTLVFPPPFSSPFFLDSFLAVFFLERKGTDLSPFPMSFTRSGSLNLKTEKNLFFPTSPSPFPNLLKKGGVFPVCGLRGVTSLFWGVGPAIFGVGTGLFSLFFL